MRITQLLVVLSCCLLVGCATTAKYQAKLNSWKGQNINNFISAWGYPDSTFKSPDGNNVYVYKTQSIQTMPYTTTGGFTTINTNGNQTVVSQTPTMLMGGGTYYFDCTTWIEFNKDNIIVRTIFRGNDCVSN